MKKTIQLSICLMLFGVVCSFIEPVSVSAADEDVCDCYSTVTKGWRYYSAQLRKCYGTCQPD